MENFLDFMCPRWYQDFSLDQMKNLMNLDNVMRIDYEEMTTNGTQTTLIAIGIISTFFKLKPNIIKKLHRSCNLNSVNFLREIYRILTGNDFCKEEYKEFYDCNERIVLSAIAFLTLPETVEELHKRLPTVIMPKLQPKPKLPMCSVRRKNSCPYKEELFKCPDWAGYRNALQKWREQCKLIAIPKMILPLKERLVFINDKILFSIKKSRKDIYTEYPEETNTKKPQKYSATNSDEKDVINIDEPVRYKNEDSSKEENLEAKKAAISNITRLQGGGKNFDFPITGLNGKSGAMKHEVCDILNPLGAGKKSWLDRKDAYYVIAGATENLPRCSVTYEITGVVNVIPSNSDERFFAELKLSDEPRKIFPSGRKNLSRHWQDWLRNADEDFKQLEEEADKIIKNIRITEKLAFSEATCDSSCLYRQTKKTHEKWQQNKTPYLLINNVVQDEEKMGLHLLNKKTDSKIKFQKNEAPKKIISAIFEEKKQYYKETAGKIGQEQDASYKQIIDKTGEKIDEERHQINSGDDKKYIDNKLNLMAIMKAELKKMAEEGYAFAKLPKCYLMPQLQDWVMYREGAVFSETDKKNLMHSTVALWQLLKMARTPEIKVSSLHMTKHQLKRLTYDQAKKIKKTVEEARAIFHSEVRKARVSYARSMWSTMEFGKFPSSSFKRAFFTYMASKEADGHVYKPWLCFEVRKRDSKFYCY